MSSIKFRQPTLNDGIGIRQLVSTFQPNELNSAYFYYLVCKHFFETSLLAEEQGNIIGFIFSYIPPQKPDALFVAHIMVSETRRREGIASSMMSHLLEQSHIIPKIEYLETALTSTNYAAVRLFHRVSQKYKTSVKERLFCSKEHLEPEAKEDKILVQIGPLTTKQKEKKVVIREFAESQ
ncbi:MAG: diaminobutyrate acetyltransferase [SAR324 cluster bacterium]|nr:diaminobutyrate acetyltransferase [SAR324 cluster bacterium]